MDQQCNEVGALKYVVKLQAGICKQVRAGAVEVKNRVTALKCQSDLLAGAATRSAEAGPSLYPGGIILKSCRRVKAKVA